MGGRARRTEWGRGSRRERQRQGEECRIKVHILYIKGHTRVPSAVATVLDSGPPGIDELGKNGLRFG